MFKDDIGIRREDKNRWETRAPLTPEQAAELHRNHKLSIVVQPSNIRVFHDADYASAGCRVDSDLSGCRVVLGVKEMPVDFFQPGQAYAFFAHVLKGQRHNMGMLARMMQLGCHLIDYERIVDEKGRRLVFFGRFAGIAGMIDTLFGLGQRLLLAGFVTPLARVKQALAYRDLESAKLAVGEVGRQISVDGLPRNLVPLVIGVAGYGNVAKGAIEILSTLGAVAVTPAELQTLDEPDADRKVYFTVFREEHTVAPKDPGRVFDLEEYYRSPDQYRSVFERYLGFLTVLVNCIYWDRRYPRLVTKFWLREAWGRRENPRLIFIGDISCDIDGAIEATVRATDPGSPFYVYEPATDSVREGLEGKGPTILAVDNLPCELPRDASVEFGKALVPFVPDIARVDFSRPLEELPLPTPIRTALILHKGELTPGYGYVRNFLVTEGSNPV
ncbi:MAG: bifunctional lysine ketoglutarate reductase /saccharopine dehydrogenase family protein [candidate division WOR-3 bacterium]